MIEYPYYQNAVDYFIHGIKKENPLTDVFNERFTRTGNGEDIYITLSGYMLNHEYSYEEYKEDINEFIKDLVSNDPNY